MAPRPVRPDKPSTAGERPSVEALTIAWMLSVVTALVCELGLVAARLYLFVAETPSERIVTLAALLLFASLVVGITALLLGMAVLRMRRVAPPRGVMVFATVIGAAPLVAVFLRLLIIVFGDAPV